MDDTKVDVKLFERTVGTNGRRKEKGKGGHQGVRIDLKYITYLHDKCVCTTQFNKIKYFNFNAIPHRKRKKI